MRRDHVLLCAEKKKSEKKTKTNKKRKLTEKKPKPKKTNKQQIKNRSAVLINSSSFFFFFSLNQSHAWRTFLRWLSLNNLVGHFLVIVGFCISPGAVWTPREGVAGGAEGVVAGWLTGWAPGVVWPIDSSHQRWTEASIKKHGASLLWGVVWAIFPLHYVCGEYVCVCVRECVRGGLWWVIEPRFSFTLCGRWAVRVTLNYCFPNTGGSMWNGRDSASEGWIREYDMWYVLWVYSRDSGELMTLRDVPHLEMAAVIVRFRWVRGRIERTIYLKGSEVPRLGENDCVDNVSRSVFIRYLREGKLTEENIYLVQRVCVCVIKQDCENHLLQMYSIITSSCIKQWLENRLEHQIFFPWGTRWVRVSILLLIHG